MTEPGKLLVSEVRYWREVAEAKRVIIRRALVECAGNQRATADALGISRTALLNTMRGLGITSDRTPVAS